MSGAKQTDEATNWKFVRFIQFLRPNARQRDIMMPCPEAIAEMAEWLWAEGYRLTAESLPTGQVSLIVDCPKEGRDVVAELCVNGPGLEAKAARLIERAYRELVG